MIRSPLRVTAPGTPGEDQGGGQRLIGVGKTNGNQQRWVPPPRPSPGIPGAGQRVERMRQLLAANPRLTLDQFEDAFAQPAPPIAK